VYGLDFYQVIRDSWVSLNIHADSSPRYASNMRLYEATGVGSCLLTDWKSNLPALFDIDKEIVSYRSSAEALEKARWLLEHPQERDEIARRGQARTLRDYTFGHQARELDSVILGGLANHKAA
jgi:spore maturation protein CgeB